MYFQGYTPLHIAAQFGHTKVYDLLIDVYGKSVSNDFLVQLYNTEILEADSNIRDYNGHKPLYYKTSLLQLKNKENHHSEYQVRTNKHEKPIGRSKSQSFLRKSFAPHIGQIQL